MLCFLVLMFVYSGKVYIGVENEIVYLFRLFSDMFGWFVCSWKNGLVYDDGWYFW